MTNNASAPFRADHVGSLLRTAPIKEARARREAKLSRSTRQPLRSLCGAQPRSAVDV